MEGPQEQPNVRVEHSRCPYCHDALLPDHEKEGCRGCMAWHHQECWAAHGGCSSCGDATRASRQDSDQSLTGLGELTATREGFLETSVAPELKVCTQSGCQQRVIDLQGDQRSVLQRCPEHAIADNRKQSQLALLVFPFMLALAALAALAGAVKTAGVFGGLALLLPFFAMDMRRKAAEWEQDLDLREAVDAFNKKGTTRREL